MGLLRSIIPILLVPSAVSGLDGSSNGARIRKIPRVAEHFEQALPDIASQSSSRERRAIDAEREVEAMKKAEYMEDYVGEEYDAVVSSVVKFGFLLEMQYG